jgi:hypothetical protein
MRKQALLLTSCSFLKLNEQMRGCVALRLAAR